METGMLGVLALIACLLGVNEIVALFGTGALGLLLYIVKNLRKTSNCFIPFPLLFFQAALPALQIGSLKIFLTFLKVGALLYGSGYVLFAFLDAELVSNGLLSRQQLIDSVAVGQFTPGPVLSTATFIGWQMNGASGALAATLGIFLPSFVFVALLNPIIPKLRQSNVIGAFLDAVNIAAVAVIVAVCVEMGKETLTDWRTILIAVISLIVTFAFKQMNSVWIVLGGAALGYLLTYL